MAFYFDDSRRMGTCVTRRSFATAEAAIDRAAYLCTTGLGATRGVFSEDGTLVADSAEIYRVGWERYRDQVDSAWHD